MYNSEEEEAEAMEVVVVVDGEMMVEEGEVVMKMW